MKINLKRALQEDIWEVINGNPLEKKDFKSLVLHLLIESESFILGDAIRLAKELEESYNKVLENIDYYITSEYGDIINVFKAVNKYYDDIIQPLLNRIKSYKKRIKREIKNAYSNKN